MLDIKNIKSVIKTSFIDWPGHISMVLFLSRCNFRCHYCHNKQLVIDPGAIKDISFYTILNMLNKYHEWIDGVVISGGEPTLNEHIFELVTIIKNIGLKVKLDTNGSRPDILKKLINDKLVDYVAMDIKTNLNKIDYSAITGVPCLRIELINKSIDLLLQNKIDYEFRTTIFPIFIKENNIELIARRIKGAKRYNLQQFRNNNTLDPYCESVTPYKKETLEYFKKIILK